MFCFRTKFFLFGQNEIFDEDFKTENEGSLLWFDDNKEVKAKLELGGVTRCGEGKRRRIKLREVGEGERSPLDKERETKKNWRGRDIIREREIVK